MKKFDEKDVFDDEIKEGFEINYEQLLFSAMNDCRKNMSVHDNNFLASVEALECILPSKDDEYYTELKKIQNEVKNFQMVLFNSNPQLYNNPKRLKKAVDYYLGKRKFELLMGYIDRAGLLPMKTASITLEKTW